MIKAIIDAAIRHRLVVLFVVLLLASLGLRALQRLPIDAVPDVTNVQVQVLTTAPALGPAEVERFVTFPVETAMSGLPGVEGIRSVSRFGLSAVTIVFEEDTDIYFARRLVMERLPQAREQIPAGYGTPEMGPISTGLGEIFQFEVRGDPRCTAEQPDTDACWTLMELRTILDWYVVPQLRSVPGVVEVNTFGGELKTYEVQVDPARLIAYRVSLEQVVEALQDNNANVGGAYMLHAGEQRLIRGEALVEDLDDLRAIVVVTRGDGTPVRITDLATVTFAPMVRQGAVTRDARGEIVNGIVMMLMGANSRQVVKEVNRQFQQIKSSLPQGVTLEATYDRTELVDRTIRTVATNLIEGAVLVVLVLLLLLGSLRGGLLVASAIPLSMLGAFIAMDIAGISGNLMSLGAIDFGLIVDGSVVMIENIVRVVAQRRVRGGEVPAAVRDAAREVGRPVVFGVAIIIMVYVPLLGLEGIEGKMFRPMAWTVVFALVTSLVLALTFMPTMATWVFRKGVRERETWLVRGLSRGYRPVLHGAVRHPVPTTVAAGLMFFASLLVVPTLGAEFVPTLDEGAIALQVARLPSVSLEEGVRSTTRVEEALLDHFPDEVVTVVSKTGRPEIATDPMGVDLSDIYVTLAPQDQWTAAQDKEELVQSMAVVLERELPGQQYSFSQPIELRTNELISGVRSDVAISIYSEDLDDLIRIGDEVAETVRSVNGAADVKPEAVGGLPVLRVRVDRQQLARYGISAATVLRVVEAMGGLVVGTVFEGQKRFALQVRLPRRVRGDPEAIERLPITTADGKIVPLGQVAKLVLEDSPVQISRDRIQRRLTVEVNVRGRDLAGFVAEAQRRVASTVELPTGAWIAWGGQFENLRAASRRLAVAVPLALVSIFVLLHLAFGSWRLAILVYLNIPFAATGGLLALALRDMPFSISAGVGFIALFGIAVLNGVVLLSRIIQGFGEGLDSRTSVTDGALVRLRPVLMTAFGAAIGFLPMAVATSAGAEVQRPLATVVIGGLVTSTVLTLVVLPAVLAWTSRWWSVPLAASDHAPTR